MDISSCIIGTWQCDQRFWPGVRSRDLSLMYQRAFDEGFSTFDTAEIYVGAERLLSRALGSKINQAVILDKVFCHHLSYDALLDACHHSLKKLGRDWIDLYQIHWPSGTDGGPIVAIEESLQAMIDLKKAGKIRGIGLSNFSLEQIEKACAFTKIDAVQLPYSLLWPHQMDRVRQYCSEHHIKCLAYSPLAQGMLTDKMHQSYRFDASDHRSRSVIFSEGIKKHTHHAQTQLKDIAKEAGVSLEVLALAWVAQQSNICPIVGFRNIKQFKMLFDYQHFNLLEVVSDNCSKVSQKFAAHVDLWDCMWFKSSINA